MNKNEALPIPEHSKVALFGGGAWDTIIGGLGSGFVYTRYKINIWDGLKNAGYDVVSGDWLRRFAAAWQKDSEAKKAQEHRYAHNVLPDPYITDEEFSAAQAKVGIYVISRISQEGADLTPDGYGAYRLSAEEEANIKTISEKYQKSIVIINTGAPVATDFLGKCPDLDGLLLMSQAGMESGNAVADIISGKVTPSGKLTDTWAKAYEDYPSSSTFSNNDGDVNAEEYTEGIYVGYRYFDTFNIAPQYEFGFGLSYTTFDVKTERVQADEKTVSLQIKVTNTGYKWAGKEVVQAYYSAPSGRLEKEHQSLIAFAKTDNLAPGQAQTLTLRFKTADMASYDETSSSYIMEAGDYVIRVGSSSRSTRAVAVLKLDAEATVEQLSHQLSPVKPVAEISPNGIAPYSYPGEKEEIAAAQVMKLNAKKISFVNNASPYEDQSIVTYIPRGKSYTPKLPNETVSYIKDAPGAKLIDVYNGDIAMEEFIAQMSVAELANLVCGAGRNVNANSYIGEHSSSVKGAAGETTSLYQRSYGIPNMVLADGPAGIRIDQSFESDGITYYQFCTAFPVGVLIAQSWDPSLLQTLGLAYGREMYKFGITLWLAPGMNIHRNPLCGRNFEYYSEDPVLTGAVATAFTQGIQSNPGVGVTIKHFAANNQENNRFRQDSIINERALREIYLKAFKMTVENAQPMAIMTSYNLINGIPAAYNYDLAMDIPRGEWKFKGLIMTDWMAGTPDYSQVPTSKVRRNLGYCVSSSNDLIMPGGKDHIAEVIADVAAPFDADSQTGISCLGHLQRAAAHNLAVTMNTVYMTTVADGFTVRPYATLYPQGSPFTVKKSE